MAFISVPGINKCRHPTVKVVIQLFSAKMDQMLIAVVKPHLVVLKVDYLYIYILLKLWVSNASGFSLREIASSENSANFYEISPNSKAVAQQNWKSNCLV